MNVAFFFDSHANSLIDEFTEGKERERKKEWQSKDMRLTQVASIIVHISMSKCSSVRLVHYSVLSFLYSNLDKIYT